MVEEFNPSQPIYFQLVQRICRQIVRGDLSPGEKLPSVREMAVQMGVNPNTVQRTYAELERMAVVETRRGLGTFVTEDQTQLKELRTNLKNEQMTAFITHMQEMGFTPQEIILGLEKALTSEKG